MPKATRTQPARIDADGAVKQVNLALQGGGAHGAFTWGVLDRLLEEKRLDFEAICGTSAGAMNAVVMTSGYTKGGRAGARAALETFWTRIGELGQWSPIQRTPWDRFFKSWRLDDSPGFLLVDMMRRIWSPYQLNPANINPLRGVLEEVVDFDIVRYDAGLKLFICATNVRTGKVKIFRNTEISVEATLASACLPDMFQAAEIRDEYYWDGGYMGNPALWPLAYETVSRDLVVVQINPLTRNTLPATAQEIADRLNEITFNATLMHEMRAIHFVNRLAASGQLDANDYKQTFVHMIYNEELMQTLHATSKMNTETAFLIFLKENGRKTAETWLTNHFADLGHRATVDMVKTFL